MAADPFAPLADDDLARRAGRDPAAFEALYHRFARRVFGLMATLRLDPHAADDVAQQVWLKVWQGLPTKPVDSPFCPWLLQVARNAAIDRLRKREAAGLPDDVPLAAGGHRDVLSDVEESADLERLRGCIGKLPDAERRVFLHRLEGVDSPAIGEAIGVPSERVHRLFHDAKQKVRRCLGVEG